MIFRKHRGSLKESMDTSIEINDLQDMLDYLKKDLEINKLDVSIKDIKINNYGYDHRLNKNLFIVTFFNESTKETGVLGFLEKQILS